MSQRSLTMDLCCAICLVGEVEATRDLPNDPHADLTPILDQLRAELEAKSADWGAILTEAGETIDICPACWSNGLGLDELPNPRESIQTAALRCLAGTATAKSARASAGPG